MDLSRGIHDSSYWAFRVDRYRPVGLQQAAAALVAAMLAAMVSSSQTAVPGQGGSDHDPECPLCANSGHCQNCMVRRYDGGKMVRPDARVSSRFLGAMLEIFTELPVSTSCVNMRIRVVWIIWRRYMFRNSAFAAVVCALIPFTNSASAQLHSPESLAGLKLFNLVIDLPINAERCGPKRKDIRDALQGVLRPSKVRMVGGNRTADGIIELRILVSENCSKTVDMSILTSVTIDKTGTVIPRLPIWYSGTINFGQGTKINGPDAVRFLGEQFLTAWGSANQQ